MVGKWPSEMERYCVEPLTLAMMGSSVGSSMPAVIRQSRWRGLSNLKPGKASNKSSATCSRFDSHWSRPTLEMLSSIQRALLGEWGCSMKGQARAWSRTRATLGWYSGKSMSSMLSLWLSRLKWVQVLRRKLCTSEWLARPIKSVRYPMIHSRSRYWGRKWSSVLSATVVITYPIAESVDHIIR